MGAEYQLVPVDLFHPRAKVPSPPCRKRKRNQTSPRVILAALWPRAGFGGRRPFAFLNQELSRGTCSASTNRQGRTCRGRAAWRSRQWWTCGWKWRLSNMRKASCLSSFRSWWSLSSTAMSRTRRWWRRAWRSSSTCSTYTRPGCPSPSTWPGICVQALQVGLLTEIAEN
ncbi:unnamed protein product, partial [Musa hybrid cultivar]